MIIYSQLFVGSLEAQIDPTPVSRKTVVKPAASISSGALGDPADSKPSRPRHRPDPLTLPSRRLPPPSLPSHVVTQDPRLYDIRNFSKKSFL
jgi:hypothetical protein